MVNSQNKTTRNRRSFTSATLSVFQDRLSRKISTTQQPHAWQGFEVESGVLPDGSVNQVFMLGPKGDDKRPDAKSRAIPLATDSRAPRIEVLGEGKVLNGHIQEQDDGSLKLVRDTLPNQLTRVFRTGLIRKRDAASAREERAYRALDMQELAKLGVKIGYHGVFALDLGSANIAATGETVEVMKVANVFDLTDDDAKKFKGIDVAESREMAAEIPVGGAVICGDLGFLTIHEVVSRHHVKIYDVTEDKAMWELFRRYAAEQLAREQAEKKASAELLAKAS